MKNNYYGREAAKKFFFLDSQLRPLAQWSKVRLQILKKFLSKKFFFPQWTTPYPPPSWWMATKKITFFAVPRKKAEITSTASVTSPSNIRTPPILLLQAIPTAQTELLAEADTLTKKKVQGKTLNNLFYSVPSKRDGVLTQNFERH